MKDYLKNYFNSHPNVGHLLKEESYKQSNHIKTANLFNLLESTVEIFDEVLEKENLLFMKDQLPRPFKHADLAKELVNHVQNHDELAFDKYKTEMFNEWQRKWLVTLANAKKQFIRINVMDYGKTPLFLINAYISEFELLHRFLLIPFTKNIGLEEDSYRNRLNVMLDCIYILEFDEKDKYNLLFKLEKIIEPKQRNSLVKHNYMFDNEENKIYLFSPDAFVRKYKPLGEIDYKQFITIVIIIKSIFWTLIRGICPKNEKLSTIVNEFISDYPSFFKVIEQKILDPELTELLNLFLQCFKSFSINIEDIFTDEHGEEIIRYQLLESFMFFRIMIGTFLKQDIIPQKHKLVNFSMFQKIIISQAMMKIQYLVTYEELMQTIIHPFTEMLHGTTHKDRALKKMNRLENGKYSVLFKELNKDFRDSLAHNSYYFRENTGWVYTKYEKVLLHNNVKMICPQLIFNYMDITNSIFPFLAEVPTELAIAQLINDLFTKDRIFTSEEWLEKEKFSLKNTELIFACMCRIRLAFVFAVKNDYSAVSNTIRELFKDNDSFKDLTPSDFDLLIAFIIRFGENTKSRLVMKTLTKRLLKTLTTNKKTKIRCLFILLFLATHRKDNREITKLLKRIEELKSN